MPLINLFETLINYLMPNYDPFFHEKRFKMHKNVTWTEALTIQLYILCCTCYVVHLMGLLFLFRYEHITILNWLIVEHAKFHKIYRLVYLNK